MDSLVDLDYDDKLKFVSKLAKPLASKKLTKKVLKLIKKSAKNKSLVSGLKNVQKRIRKGEKGITVIAGDVSPPDTIAHFPVWCEEQAVPFVFIPLRYDISAAMKVRRPCVMVMIRKDPEAEELYDQCLSTIMSLPAPSQFNEPDSIKEEHA
ncbi:NHP2 ribonucleoprotein [Brevipalpus obovatus]|uniref:NHP2 ribonucleoprotein n=1 Tax=Brevipalpus obovatus TaxID=246614 RepID=UPI003D9E450A